MSIVLRRHPNLDILGNLMRTSVQSSRKASDETEFRILNIRGTKAQTHTSRRINRAPVAPPRHHQMAVDQDWGNVWPGPRSFHPATVPLPLRQGYAEKRIPPNKYANAELMKIPNFLHLTPPVIKRHCEVLKQFCTPWPKTLDTNEKCEKHFPLEVCSSTYLYSSPTIRDNMARIVTIRFKLASLKLDSHAKDKFRRLIGERYDEDTDTVTIVTDRCPLRSQNYDYAMYLMTALYHESCREESWEGKKSADDMEYYDWDKSNSKKNIEALFGKPTSEIPNSETYSVAISDFMNEGENEYTINKYGEAVRQLLQVPGVGA